MTSNPKIEEWNHITKIMRNSIAKLNDIDEENIGIRSFESDQDSVNIYAIATKDGQPTFIRQEYTRKEFSVLFEIGCLDPKKYKFLTELVQNSP